jgi:flagellar basal-body rod protein FlgC
MAVDGMAISLSGLLAASQRVAVSANNIANQQSLASEGVDGGLENTPYVPQDVVQLSAEAGGVTTQVQGRNPASVQSYRPDSPLADEGGLVNAPNVDPTVELVNQQIAVYDFKANLKALKVQDEMQREVLNIIT